MNINFYFAPWRLITLYVGTALLCIGADIYKMPDWDAGVSILMAVLCYLTAPWGVYVVKNIKREWKLLPLAFFLSLFTVNVSYSLYNGVLGREFYLRENFNASMPLYWMMGFIWFFGADIWRALQKRTREQYLGSL